MIYGEPIVVDGKRPDWLRDETLSYSTVVVPDSERTTDVQSRAWQKWTPAQWRCIYSIRLDASHGYYKATAAGFTYWPGGDAAPADWDGGEVLFSSGTIVGDAVGNAWDWRRCGAGEIIGYRKRAVPVSEPLYERMERLVRLMAAEKFPSTHTSSAAFDEARALMALIEPVDPLLLRAREICAAECGDQCRAAIYRAGEWDDAMVMRVVLVALRERAW